MCLPLDTQNVKGNFCCPVPAENGVYQYEQLRESQNKLSWKGPARIIKSNSCPAQAIPRSHTMCLRALAKHFLNSVRLGADSPVIC